MTSQPSERIYGPWYCPKEIGNADKLARNVRVSNWFFKITHMVF